MGRADIAAIGAYGKGIAKKQNVEVIPKKTLLRTDRYIRGLPDYGDIG